ncbi:hypothetical protein ACSZNX_14930 [Aeromonas veronii]
MGDTVGWLAASAAMAGVAVVASVVVRVARPSRVAEQICRSFMVNSL